MPRKDLFHETVKRALVADGWVITQDPYVLRFARMDRLSEYREIIKRVLRDYAAFDPGEPGVEAELVFDNERGHYELLYTGWDGWKRIHGSVIHLDIRDGKIWIQHDGTEEGVANELVEAGIPREQIVLAFHHPSKRQYTEFAAG